MRNELKLALAAIMLACITGLLCSCVMQIHTVRSSGCTTQEFNARDSGAVTNTSSQDGNKNTTEAGKKTDATVDGELGLDVSPIP